MYKEVYIKNENKRTLFYCSIYIYTLFPDKIFLRISQTFINTRNLNTLLTELVKVSKHLEKHFLNSQLRVK